MSARRLLEENSFEDVEAPPASSTPQVLAQPWQEVNFTEAQGMQTPVEMALWNPVSTAALTELACFGEVSHVDAVNLANDHATRRDGRQRLISLFHVAAPCIYWAWRAMLLTWTMPIFMLIIGYRWSTCEEDGRVLYPLKVWFFFAPFAVGHLGIELQILGWTAIPFAQAVRKFRFANKDIGFTKWFVIGITNSCIYLTSVASHSLFTATWLQSEWGSCQSAQDLDRTQNNILRKVLEQSYFLSLLSRTSLAFIVVWVFVLSEFKLFYTTIEMWHPRLPLSKPITDCLGSDKAPRTATRSILEWVRRRCCLKRYNDGLPKPTAKELEKEPELDAVSKWAKCGTGHVVGALSDAAGLMLISQQRLQLRQVYIQRNLRRGLEETNDLFMNVQGYLNATRFRFVSNGVCRCGYTVNLQITLFSIMLNVNHSDRFPVLPLVSILVCLASSIPLVVLVVQCELFWWDLINVRMKTPKALHNRKSREIASAVRSIAWENLKKEQKNELYWALWTMRAAYVVFLFLLGWAVLKLGFSFYCPSHIWNFPYCAQL